MSVVVRDCTSRKIFLLSKGVDEAILPCAHAGIIYCLLVTPYNITKCTMHCPCFMCFFVTVVVSISLSSDLYLYSYTYFMDILIEC